MALNPARRISRRKAFGAGVALAGSAFLLSGLRRLGPAPSLALSSAPSTRYLQINLIGGWDSALATDPVVGSKARSTAYQVDYREPVVGMEPKVISGKPTLTVGPGLVTAESAFMRMPTAFVNGIYMQVPGHEFALQYMLSGRLTLSSSREFPAIPAILAGNTAVYPPHVVVGGFIPLGDSLYTNPPLHAVNLEALTQMLTGPSGHRFDQDLIDDAHALLETLDASVVAGLPAEHRRDLKAWRDATENVRGIYARSLQDDVTLTEALRESFQTERYYDGTDGPETQLAAAFVLMRANLCSNITVGINGVWDSHANHLALHLPYMKRFGAALSALVDEMAKTDDPAVPGSKLSDTTTIVITSEFVRSPLFNPLAGTEHWSSASAIVMGRGVNDGAVIGATDDSAFALGWADGRAVPYTEETKVLPDLFVATVLSKVGTEAQANSISEKRLDGLFT